jgi:hypothetical protein
MEASALTDSLGNYQVNDLAPGSYHAVASGNYGINYVQQAWNHVDCLNDCDPTTGTAISVGQAATVSDIDFSVAWRDAVVGRVTNDAGEPVSGVIVDMFYGASGNYQGSGVSDASGHYAAYPFGVGPYFVATEAGGAYVDQVYSQIDCPNGPAYYGLCSLTGAAQVTVGGAGTQPHIVNFVLAPQGTIFRNGFEPAP